MRIEQIPEMAVTGPELIRESVCPPGLLPWSGEPLGVEVWSLTLLLALSLGFWLSWFLCRERDA